MIWEVKEPIAHAKVTDDTTHKATISPRPDGLTIQKAKQSVFSHPFGFRMEAPFDVAIINSEIYTHSLACASVVTIFRQDLIFMVRQVPSKLCKETDDSSICSAQLTLP